MPPAGLPAGGILCYTKNMKISRLLQEEELKPQIVISVRNLVEFLMNAGDIDDRHGGQMRMEAMQEGQPDSPQDPEAGGSRLSRRDPAQVHSLL